MTPEIQAVIAGGAIAGAFLIVGTILGAWLNRTTEHTRWLRQERLNAYTDLLAISSRILHTPSSEPKVLHELLHDMSTTVHRSKLLTETAWKEIDTIEGELINYIATITLNDTENADKARMNVARTSAKLQLKGRKELKNRAITASEVANTEYTWNTHLPHNETQTYTDPKQPSTETAASPAQSTSQNRRQEHLPTQDGKG